MSVSQTSESGPSGTCFLLQLKEDFQQLLKETPDINRNSRWGDVKHRIDTDPRYIAVDSSPKREEWFKDYVKDLGVNICCISIALDKGLFFNQRVSVFFLFLDKNICCGYSLEAPHRGASDEYPQHMFSSRNKKNKKTIYLIPTLI